MVGLPSLQSLVGDHAGGAAGYGVGNAGVDWSQEYFWQLNNTYITRYGVQTGLEEVATTLVDAGGQNENVGVCTNGQPTFLLTLTGGGSLYNGGLVTASTTDGEFTSGLNYPAPNFGTGGMTITTSGSPPYTVWDKCIGNTVIGTLNRTQVSFVNPPGPASYADTVNWPSGYSRCYMASLTASFSVFSAYSNSSNNDVYLDRLVAPIGVPVAVHHVGTYAAADIDAGWTNCFIGGITMDRGDEHPIMLINGDASPYNRLVKVDWGTGDVIWNVEAPDNFGDVLLTGNMFQHCYIRNSRLALFTNSPAKVTVYDTTDGSVTNTYTAGLAGISQIGWYGGQCYNDTLGCIALQMSFTETAGSPELRNSTPSSFSGWALLYVDAPVPPPATPRRFLAELGPIRDIQLGPPVPPGPPSNSVGAIGLDIAVAGFGSGGSAGTIALDIDVDGVGAAGSAATGTIGLDIAVSGVSASGPVTGLTPWTITELGGVARTNVPIEIWVPFSGAAGPYPFDSSDAIQIVDSDGVTVIPCQEDNRSSDQNGDIRGMKVTAILPTLGVRQTRQLSVRKLATTLPDTGTDISVSDLTAISYDCSLSMALDDGNIYTASAAAALAASTWTNKATAANKGKWRTGGGIVTEYIGFCPFRNGGTPTPDNFGVWFEIAAYKAGRGAVSPSNPIIGVKTHYWVGCGYAQATGIQNHYFDLTAASGTNVQAWVGSTPSKTLTLSANGNQTDAIATVTTAQFAADSVGNVIGDGTGYARVYQYDSPTQVRVKICKAMSGISIGSGAWRIYGLNNQYASNVARQEIWFGGSPSITAKPDIDSSLGVAWNPIALTGGPFSYFNACKVILPYTTPASAVTNNMSKLVACGANPTGMISGYAGDIVLYMPTTGGRDDIAPIPGWYVGGLIRYDSNGKARIMGNANKLALFPIFWTDQNTGKAPQFNNGTNWVTDSSWSGTFLPTGIAYYSGVQQISDATYQIAHHPGTQYVPYLLTGDYFWIEQLQRQLFYIWAANNPGYHGSQLNRMGCNASELRGNGWSWRDLMQAIFMTPDSSPSVLSYTRSHLQTWHDNQFTATNSGTPNIPPFPGNDLGLINNTGSGKTYATAGYRGMGQGGGGNASLWQLGYMAMAFFLCEGAGMLNSKTQAFATWFMEGLTGAATGTGIVPNWFVPCYYATVQDNTGTTVNSWINVYRWTGMTATETGMARRLVTGGGITLSGLTGSVTATLPAGYVTTGGSAFYSGGMFRDINAASLQSIPAVTAGGSGYSVSDTIEVDISSVTSGFTVSRKAELTVATVSGGAVTSVTVSDPGLYIALNPGEYGSTGRNLTQSATSGAGTGATFQATLLDNNGNTSSAIRFGTAKITSIAGNVVTMTTSGVLQNVTLTNYCYGFAQTGLVSNKIQIPVPAVGDVNGYGSSGISAPAMPQPYTGGYEYWDIALQCATMASSYGYANAPAALAVITACYTGPSELKWKVS